MTTALLYGLQPASDRDDAGGAEGLESGGGGARGRRVGGG